MKAKHWLICVGIVFIVFVVFLIRYFDIIFDTIVLLTDSSTSTILHFPNSKWESADGELTIAVTDPNEYGKANFALLTYDDGTQTREYGIVSTVYGVIMVIEEADEEEAAQYFGSHPPDILGYLGIYAEKDGYLVMRFSDHNTLPPYYDEEVWPWQRFIRFNRVS